MNEKIKSAWKLEREKWETNLSTKLESTQNFKNAVTDKAVKEKKKTLKVKNSQSINGSVEIRYIKRVSPSS